MTDPYDPQELVLVDARVPRWLLDAARSTNPTLNTSEILRRGLAALAGVDPPLIRVGRHERKDTP